MEAAWRLLRGLHLFLVTAPDPVDSRGRHEGIWRSAIYVGRGLKRSKPAELPVEQPTTSEFVTSLRTAGALGPTILRSMLSMADEVIQ